MIDRFFFRRRQSNAAILWIYSVDLFNVVFSVDQPRLLYTNG